MNEEKRQTGQPSPPPSQELQQTGPHIPPSQEPQQSGPYIPPSQESQQSGSHIPSSQELPRSEPQTGQGAPSSLADGDGNPPERKRRFGRGIYEKTDVPIRWLDRLIGGIIAVVVIMIVIFAMNGGYTISFDTGGGTQIAPQKLRYGNHVSEPETPARPGYVFDGWYFEETPEETWDFAVGKVGGDFTLVARWQPAKITVRLDADGGSLPSGEEALDVTYLETYGELPVPVKEGGVFAGWEYAGQRIEADTVVSMPGEHVLTAVWEE